MQTKEIELSDKEKVEALRRKYGHETSSHAFPSLYIWKEDLGSSLYIEEDVFTVKCSGLGSNTWFFPCGAPERVFAVIEELSQVPDLNLIYMRQEDKIRLEEWFPNRFRIREVQSDGEYIYDRSEQEVLRGQKFASMRQEMNKGIRQFNYEVVPFTGKEIPFLIAVRNQIENESRFAGTKDATRLMLEQWDALGLTGITVLMDGRPYAVTAGFPLSEDTFDLCLLKQRAYLTGLSVFARCEMYKRLPANFTKINCEEDMGIAGIRKMKELMRPISITRMYEAGMEKEERDGETNCESGLL